MQERADSLDHRPAGRPIVLTTDFGLADPFVGVMKGVVLGINPLARLIDLTHQIQPQSIPQAAFVLGASHRFFPAGAIHVVVVDPGVGTQRRALLLVTPTAQFLAPDNGVLSHIIADYLEHPPQEPGLVPLPPEVAAYQLTNHEYWLQPVSNTFHGRDIFAPVAAHLSLGVPPEDLGQPVANMVWLPSPRPEQQGDTILGQVVYADHFGNLVTNVPALELQKAGSVQVEIKGRRISRLSRSFHDPQVPAEGGLVALVGSHGYLEIAVPDDNASLILGVDTGEPVYVSSSPVA